MLPFTEIPRLADHVEERPGGIDLGRNHLEAGAARWGVAAEAVERWGIHRGGLLGWRVADKADMPKALARMLGWAAKGARVADQKLIPPKGVQSACRRGLDLAAEFGGPGLTEGAKARAREMAAGRPVTPEQLSRMAAFFSRHAKNRADPSAAEPTPGALAWLIWGGDAGRDWAEAHAGQTEKSQPASCDLIKSFIRQALTLGEGPDADR